MTQDGKCPAKWRSKAFYYVVAAGMLLLAAIGIPLRMEWYESTFLGAAGVLVLLGVGPQLYRAAVYRKSEREVLCRYVPWYQANAIAITLTFPLMGVAAIAGGRAPGSPFWMYYGGYFILVLGVVFTIMFVFLSFNRLCFTPSALVVRMLHRRFNLPRERICGFPPRNYTVATTGELSSHFDVVYDPADGRTNRMMMFFDMQFSVDRTNLLAALQAWKDGDAADPQLLDRVEAILRGQSRAGA